MPYDPNQYDAIDAGTPISEEVSAALADGGYSRQSSVKAAGWLDHIAEAMVHEVDQRRPDGYSMADVWTLKWDQDASKIVEACRRTGLSSEPGTMPDQSLESFRKMLSNDELRGMVAARIEKRITARVFREAHGYDAGSHNSFKNAFLKDENAPRRVDPRVARLQQIKAAEAAQQPTDEQTKGRAR